MDFPVWRRRHLVHVLPDLRVCGPVMHAWDMINTLKEYRHTVLFEGSMLDRTSVDSTMLDALLYAGIDTMHVAEMRPDGDFIGGWLPGVKVTEDMLNTGEYDAVILHSVFSPMDQTRLSIPSIYYSYGSYDPRCQTTKVVCCSEFAKTISRAGMPLKLPDDTLVIPPGIPARYLRRAKREDDVFTVGVINTGSYRKYPLDLVRYFLTYLRDDIHLQLSVPNYLTEQLREYVRLVNRKVTMIPVMGYTSRQPLQKLDVLVYGGTPNYHSPYSRTAIEAMAMGIPVVCQRQGFLTTQLEDSNQVLFFVDRKEALTKVHMLHDNRAAAQTLGLNGKAWALGQDHTVYTNQFRSLLRQLGV
jgi:glycosyltransferase involved in cell wall biosynthesis